MMREAIRSSLVVWIALAAPGSFADPVPPGSTIELLPAAGASFFATTVVTSPDGANVYAGDAFYVRTLARDGQNGELTEIDLDAVQNAAIAISPDGAHLYAAGIDAQTFHVDRLEVFARDAESGLLEPVATVTPETGGTEALDGIVSLAVSPDGAFLYVVTTGSHGILVFARDAPTGTLGTPPLAIDMTITPTKIVISPDGAHAYVSSNAEEEVRVYSRDAETGALTLLDTLSQLVFTVDDEPSTQLDVAISPDGASVQVTSAPEGTITAFTRDPGTGALAFADEVVLGPCIFNTRTTLRLAAGDALTWVSCFTGRGPQPTSVDRLVLIALSRNGGTLVQIDDVTQIGTLSASDLALAPDEGQVYFAGYPSGVGGARLVPEPQAGALAAAAAAALFTVARIRARGSARLARRSPLRVVPSLRSAPGRTRSRSA